MSLQAYDCEKDDDVEVEDVRYAESEAEDYREYSEPSEDK